MTEGGEVDDGVTGTASPSREGRGLLLKGRYFFCLRDLTGCSPASSRR